MEEEMAELTVGGVASAPAGVETALSRQDSAHDMAEGDRGGSPPPLRHGSLSGAECTP